jgi:hypothetical protein
MPPCLRLHAVLASTLAALVAPPARAQPRPPPAVFDVTVTSIEVSGGGCGHNMFLGSLRVHVDRAVSGPAPTGDVRVIGTCLWDVPGRHLRITGRLVTPHHGVWSSLPTRHRIPVDAVPTYRVIRREAVPAAPPP